MRYKLLARTFLSGLVLVGLAVAQNPSLTVDTTREREPISKYIYGQFIEHLGRCIYGGIWSEMLEDRKFYYPVTGDMPGWTVVKPGTSTYQGEGHPYELLTRSPWMIIGARDAVRMETANSYVGEQTPRIQLPGEEERGGLSQEGLGLVEGRDYTGRVVLAGDASAAPIEVTLVWGAGASDRQSVVIKNLTGEYGKYPVRFTAGRSTDNGRLEITSRGTGSFRVGTASLMPADNLFGWRADTVAMLRQLNAPVYRWPGGNFVSGYDWKDGIGDPDRRPPRKNPAWTGIEHNDVGIHEFMELCRLIEAEGFIAVNTGLGDVGAAAEEVEYVNGAATTPMGKLRAQNGHPEPWGVKWWAVGNEMYGNWQLGHMPLSEYVKKHNSVAEAIWAVDPSAQLIAVGHAGEWSQTMMANAAEHMNLISEHLYWQSREDVVEHIRPPVEQIREVADAHREYRKTLDSLQGKDIRIAMDEWNYWYGPNEFGELGVRYFLQDALGIAAGLHEYFRNSDIYFMANYAQTVNVIGAIKTTKTAVEMEATGLVLQLYRHHFGQIPVAVSGSYNPMDISAALTEDRTRLTVGIVNPTTSRQDVALTVGGKRLAGGGHRWVITGPDRYAHNDPERPRQVDIQSEALRDVSGTLSAPALSITLYELPVQ